MAFDSCWVLGNGARARVCVCETLASTRLGQTLIGSY